MCSTNQFQIGVYAQEECAWYDVTCETPPAETPAEEVPPAETPAEEVPPAETPAEEVPPAETPAEEVPPAETPAEEVYKLLLSFD